MPPTAEQGPETAYSHSIHPSFFKRPVPIMNYILGTSSGKIGESNDASTVKFLEPNLQYETCRLYPERETWVVPKPQINPPVYESNTFPPYGKPVVSGVAYKKLHIGGRSRWPAIRNLLSGHSKHLNRVAFSPDGKHIVSAADDEVQLWDAGTGEVISGPFRGHIKEFNCVIFSPDGRRVASGSVDGTIRLWDAETGEVVVGPIHGHSKGVNCIAFSPDGNSIVSGAADKTIRVWKAETGEMVTGPLRGHDKEVNCIAFSPDGRRVASGSADKTIRLWDAETGEVVVGPIHRHGKGVTSVRFSPDGDYIVSGSIDEANWIRIAAPRAVGSMQYEGNLQGVKSVTFSPDGRQFIAGSEEYTIQTKIATAGDGSLRRRAGRLIRTRYSLDGRHVASSSEDDTTIRDAETGEVLDEPGAGRTRPVRVVAFWPHCPFTIRSAGTAEVHALWKGHARDVVSIAYSPHGRYAAAGKNYSLWDLANGVFVGEPRNENAGSLGDLSDRRTRMLAGELKKVPFSDACILDGRNAAFLRDDWLIESGSKDSTTRIWDAKTGDAANRLWMGHLFDEGVSTSPDRQRLISIPGDGTLTMRVAETKGAVSEPLRGHIDSAVSASSPEGLHGVRGTGETIIPPDAPDLTYLNGQVVIPDYRLPRFGRVSLVHRGIWGGKQVAVKVFKAQKRKAEATNWERGLIGEIGLATRMWSTLAHPNILPFYGHSDDFGDFGAFISPWCERGTAHEYLQSRSLSLYERFCLTQGVCKGLQYLHHRSLVHGDLKPMNILIDEEGVSRISDIGLYTLAHHQELGDLTRTTVYDGPERYMASELFASADGGPPVFTFEGDIYSLGCIALEFLERLCPFQRLSSNREVSDAILSALPPALRSESKYDSLVITEPLWNLLSGCWNSEPASRPNAAAVVTNITVLAKIGFDDGYGVVEKASSEGDQNIPASGTNPAL